MKDELTEAARADMECRQSILRLITQHAAAEVRRERDAVTEKLRGTIIKIVDTTAMGDKERRMVGPFIDLLTELETEAQGDK